MKTIKYYSLGIGLGGMFFAALVLYYIFLTAILGGNGFTVLVDFNHFGEAIYEIVFLIILFPFMLYALVWGVRRTIIDMNSVKKNNAPSGG